MAETKVIRAAEVKLEVAQADDFSDSVIIGRVQNVQVSISPIAGVVNDLGSFTPVEVYFSGQNESNFQFSMTPETDTDIVAQYLIPNPANRSSFGGFNLRLSHDDGRVFAELIQCAPSGAVSISISPLDRAEGSYSGIAKEGTVLNPV